MTSRCDNYWYWLLGRADFSQAALRQEFKYNLWYIDGWNGKDFYFFP